MPPLDPDFRPIILDNRLYEKELDALKEWDDITIGLERSNGLTSIFKTKVFKQKSNKVSDNFIYIERLVKMLL